METIKPIFLLADSQLLFTKNKDGVYYSKVLLGNLTNTYTRCAYIGASNNDEPEYYQLFCEGMEIAGISNYRMITSAFNADEQKFLKAADMIVLAGGDTEHGLDVFRRTGIEEVLQKKLSQGAILLGVSAGAVQLGWETFVREEGQYVSNSGLRFIPFIVQAHATDEELEQMEQLLEAAKSIKKAYEIPAGGGLVYYPDNTVEAIRKPVKEYILIEGELKHTLIFPESK